MVARYGSVGLLPDIAHMSSTRVPDDCFQDGEFSGQLTSALTPPSESKFHLKYSLRHEPESEPMHVHVWISNGTVDEAVKR